MLDRARETEQFYFAKIICSDETSAILRPVTSIDILSIRALRPYTLNRPPKHTSPSEPFLILQKRLTGLQQRPGAEIKVFD
jgi:hypothetical protein